MKRANRRLAHREEPEREEPDREKAHAAPANFAILFAAASVAILVVMFFVALISISSATVASAAVSPHGPYALNASECATCHRVHTGKNRNLLKSVAPESNLCFTCHDGTGANTNVKAQFTDPLVPQNDVANRLIYRHDPVPTTLHTRASLNEFGGVLNRHSECGDCHNSHKANGTNNITTTTGVSASGRLAGISGVSVVNGAAGTAPTYTFLPGGTNPITREYQLCFKCHSGFTTLLSNAGFVPSRWRLDKGVEFNPNNLSYHPIEAPGRNTTSKMAASLAGPSPYKQWTLTTSSVISCANCHTSSTNFNLVSPPSANSDLTLHTSKYPGILRQNYRNRLLKPATELYKDSDFALCLMCHSNTPFATDGGGIDRTNFFLHGYHTAVIHGMGAPGTLIDVPGAGGGNAICAECHFRQHSTIYKAGTQTIPGSRLVSFAPNVQPYGGVISWTPGGTIGTGSCTLTCHGIAHSPKTY